MSDRFKSPSPPPEGHGRELLTILIEECAEVATSLAAVQQRATKALRFGISEKQPGQDFTNAERLGAEIGVLIEMIERVKAAGLIHQSDIDMGRRHKQRQLAVYMQTEP